MFTPATTRNYLPNKQAIKKTQKPVSPPDLKPEGIKSAALTQLLSNITSTDNMYRRLHKPLHTKLKISKTTFQTSLKGGKAQITIAMSLRFTDPKDPYSHLDSATENKWRAQV